MAQDLVIYLVFPHLTKTESQSMEVQMDKLVSISFPFAIQQLF